MRDHLRALLVSLHLLAVLLMSIPAPAGMTEKSLKDENLQSNFRDWAQTAQSIGLDLTASDIEDLSWTWGRRILGVRDAVLKPFRPYYKYVGTHQRWQMFGYLNRNPGRIEVATCSKPIVKRCASTDWEWRFIMGSDDKDWLRPLIEQERMRAIVSSFAWKRRRPHFNTLGRWLATQAAEDFPDARFLRIQMVPLEIPPPAELKALDSVPTGDSYWDSNFRIPDAEE